MSLTNSEKFLIFQVHITLIFQIKKKLDLINLIIKRLCQQEKKYKWPMDIGKDAQYLFHLNKCKSYNDVIWHIKFTEIRKG